MIFKYLAKVGRAYIALNFFGLFLKPFQIRYYQDMVTKVARMVMFLLKHIVISFLEG